MIPVDATELDRIADCVHVALVGLGVEQFTVEVHQCAGKWVVRVRVLLAPWSLKRLWWWWHGMEAFNRYDRHVLRYIGMLEGIDASEVSLFLSLEEP